MSRLLPGYPCCLDLQGEGGEERKCPAHPGLLSTPKSGDASVGALGHLSKGYSKLTNVSPLKPSLERPVSVEERARGTRALSAPISCSLLRPFSPPVSLYLLLSPSLSLSSSL